MRHLLRCHVWMIVVLGVSVVALAAVTARSSYRGPDEDSASTESDAAYRLCQWADSVSAAPLPPLATLPPLARLGWHAPTVIVVLPETLTLGVLLPRAPPALFRLPQ